MNSLPLRYFVSLLVLGVCAPTPGAAQQDGRLPVHAEVSAGGELESYLRTLQVAGRAPLYPWSVRGFSPRELRRIAAVDSAHPWGGRYELRPPVGPFLTFVTPGGELAYNTAFPYGMNNGPRWTGRGATAAVSLGVAGGWGPLSFTLVPEAFVAENRTFALMANGFGGDSVYASPVRPTGIDLPQRFGNGSYGRIDPGESGVRMDLPYVAAGLSSRAQFWGPAGTHPILLGNNAGGFPHAFLGSSEPVNVWVGRVHGRLVWGELSHSSHAILRDPDARRMMSGIVGVFVPRWIPGLEIGGGRFFHTPWPEDGWSLNTLLKPLEGILKESLDTGRPDNNDPDNQLAAAFFRWAAPGAGFEVYGEFGREDHNWNSRDLLLEPDHISAYMLGFRRVWDRGENELLALRGELVNGIRSHLVRTRHQSQFYVHSSMQQGHTHNGQTLGSPAVFGGMGGVLAVDRYHQSGRWTLAASRLVRAEVAPHTVRGVPQPGGLDVLYGVDAETVVFLRGLDLTARLSAVQNLNRNFEQDRFNLGGALGVQWRP